MAVVTGVSLATIRSLKGLVTFKAVNGRIIVSQHMPPLGPPKSLKVQVNTARFRIACLYLKTLSKQIVDLWRERANESQWTWKDIFISTFMKQWSSNNAPPQVVTSQSQSFDGDETRLNFTFADWYYGDHFGYGTDGYGTCPYGTPTDLTENQPHAITPRYQFGFYPPLPAPTFKPKED